MTVAAALAGQAALLPMPAAASTKTCTVSAAGADYATIKSAVGDAACDVIRVAPGIYPERIRISRSVRILGAGAATTVVDAHGTDSVITTSCGSEEVTVQGLTLRGGSAPAGGGIENCAKLTVRGAWILSNTALNGQGGGIDNAGDLTVRSTTIAGNRAAGASGAGGGIFNRGRFDLAGVTISGNVAGFRSGGIHAQGGSLSSLRGVTLSGNRAGDTGGAMVVAAGAKVDMVDSTVAANKVTNATGAGGVWILGTLIARSSIVAANDGDDCAGPVRSHGHNLGADGTCFRGATDRRRSKPRLAALADNGGPVWTMALPSTSPAVNAGFAPGPSCGGADARGVPRPGGSRCDIGAYERVTCLGVTVDHVGTPGDDRLTGTPSRDGFLTFEGDDSLDGGDGDDAICAGEGTDSVTAGAGDDLVRGGAGADRLVGGGGDDAIWGERGRDRIDGGSGRDRCSGGPGRDALANCAP